MTALTKALMADKLCADVGLNKRESKEIVEQFFEEMRATLEDGKSTSCQALAISTCAIRIDVRAEIQKQVKKYRLLPAVL